MPTASIMGVSMYYKEAGQGFALILVPGLGGDSRAFNPIFPFMRKKGFRLVAFDPRGLGRSEGSLEGVSMEQLVLDVLGLVDHLDIREAFFLGASLGALVVKNLAVACPRLVKGLILCTPPPVSGPIVMEWSKRLGELINESPIHQLMARLLEAMVSPQYWTKNTVVLQELASQYGMDERTRRAMIRQLEVWTEQENEWFLPEVPCLILGGEQDRLVGKEELKRISQLIPGSRLVVLEGVGHHLILEAPWRVAQEVSSFAQQAMGKMEA